MTGPSCRASTRLTAVTSSSSEVSGCWTMATWYPSFSRISARPRQPEPSAKEPCTSTMFLTELAAGAADAPLAARVDRAAQSRVARRFILLSLMEVEVKKRRQRATFAAPAYRRTDAFPGASADQG